MIDPDLLNGIVKPERGSRRVAAPSYSYFETESRCANNGEAYDVEVPYMLVTCAVCGNQKTVHGHERASYDAACVALRDTCPKGQQNFYAEP